MCRISGCCLNGPAPLSVMRGLLLGGVYNGKDATGVASLNGMAGADGISVVKDKGAASEFLTKHAEVYGAIAARPLAIQHNRASTQGSVDFSGNNHPVVYGGVAVVHNGVVQNDDRLFRELGLERRAQVDTEIIPAILSRGTMLEALPDLQRIEGSLAIAAISAAEPDALLLLRHGSPLAIALKDDGSGLYFASTTEMLKSALGGKTERTCFGFCWDEPAELTGFHFLDLTENVAYIVRRGVGLAERITLKFEERRNFFGGAAWPEDVKRDFGGKRRFDDGFEEQYALGADVGALGRWHEEEEENECVACGKRFKLEEVREVDYDILCLACCEQHYSGTKCGVCGINEAGVSYASAPALLSLGRNTALICEDCEYNRIGVGDIGD